MTLGLGDAGGRGGLTIVGHPESGLGERAHWPSGIPGGAGEEGMMDRPAFPIRLLFQLTDQRDGGRGIPLRDLAEVGHSHGAAFGSQIE
jgi:hypothetical protein